MRFITRAKLLGKQLRASSMLRTAVLVLIMYALPGWPQPAVAEEYSDLERCIIEAMQTAGDDETIGQLRQSCTQKLSAPTETANTEEGAVERRLAQDSKNTLEPFTLMAHKPNYLLVASHNFSGLNAEPYQEQFDDPTIELNDTEAVFQFSLKFPLLVGLWKDRVDLFGAYTNRSFWQIYDTESAPFRETNHEPEIWLQFRNQWKFGGFTNPANQVGFVHQSNGRGGVLSRSWNRVYANFIFEHNNWVLSIKPWYRLPEDDKDDDNPDITDYLGHGRLLTAYKWHDNTFSLMLRNNIESGFSKGAVELSWSFPIWKYRFLKGYVQYFNGYGYNLIDYDQHSNTLGIGVLLTDWL